MGYVSCSGSFNEYVMVHASGDGSFFFRHLYGLTCPTRTSDCLCPMCPTWTSLFHLISFCHNLFARGKRPLELLGSLADAAPSCGRRLCDSSSFLNSKLCVLLLCTWPESRCSNGNSSRMSRCHCVRLGLWLLGVSRAMAGAATSCGRKQCMFFLFLRYEHFACCRSALGQRADAAATHI